MSHAPENSYPLFALTPGAPPVETSPATGFVRRPKPPKPGITPFVGPPVPGGGGLYPGPTTGNSPPGGVPMDTWSPPISKRPPVAPRYIGPPLRSPLAASAINFRDPRVLAILKTLRLF